MAKRRGVTEADETQEDQSAGEEQPESGGLTEEQMARRQELKTQDEIRRTHPLESDQKMTSDEEANGGEANTGQSSGGRDIVVTEYRGQKPVRENRREARMREEAKRGPLARYEFRLMVGGHAGADYEQKPMTDPVTGEVRADRRRPTRSYEAGERVWSNTDLAKSLNRPGSIKFKLIKDWGEQAYTDGIDPNAFRKPKRLGGRAGESLEEEQPELPKKSELEQMSYGELREFAAREEIELHGSRTKEEVVQAIMKGAREKAKTLRAEAGVGED